MQSDHHVRSSGAFKRRWLCWPVLGLALLGAGCAGLDVPSADNHLPSGQKTLRAVHHWDVLAQDMATRIAEKTRDWPAGEHPIYVTSKADTRFNQGFRKLLITRLVEQGVTVSTESTAVHLVFEAQVVQHLQPASSVLHWIPLASGVSVARDGVHYHGANSFSPSSRLNGDGARKDMDTPAMARPSFEGDVVVAPGSAFGAAVAAAAAMPPTPIRKAAAAPDTPVDYPRLGTPSRSEVLVTASLESGGRYLAGTSDVYSLTHDDALLYLPAEPRLPGPAPASIKTWRVVSP
jgi:hypothetical protein